MKSNLSKDLDPSLGDLVDPIEFIRREHDRQCEICDQLENLANFPETPHDSASIEAIRGFLARDLSLHIDDEEIDLFPAVAGRCDSDDVWNDILYQLTSEHELDRALARPILEELDNISESGSALNAVRFARNVQAFVETQRRHLSWENRVLLPFADKQLTDEDKVAIGARMASRRSATTPD